MVEKPLVTWGEIADHLNVSEETARKIVRDKSIPVFYLGKLVAIYPSTLKNALEGRAA